MSLNTCTGSAIYIPESKCDDCSALEARVKKLETLLDGLRRVSFAKTDADSSQEGVFIGKVE